MKPFLFYHLHSIEDCTASQLNMKPIFWFCTTLLTAILLPVSGQSVDHRCRSYCGNITVDYPFGIRHGCGHAGYRDLLFCINDMLMLHIQSGSYRVLNIDYAYRVLTLHDAGMSTCSVLKRGAGNGFVLEKPRARYLKPTSDNVFMLIGCNADSPLFQGFPTRNLPCQNVSGMGCEGFYECPAWYGQRQYGRSQLGPNGGATTPAGPPDCCAVSFEAIRAINLSRLQCDGYSSAYALAPLHLESASQWMYGIHVTFSIPESHSFCQACEATGGTCGYDVDAGGELCLCNGWNSTISCDPALPLAAHSQGGIPSENAFTVFTACLMVWLAMVRLK